MLKTHLSRVFVSSSYEGFIPRRVLELKFIGSGPMGRPRRRRLSQLLENEDREELARNCKGKTGAVSSIDLYRMETVLEEEDIQVLT
jgi:hypothetical protein